MIHGINSPEYLSSNRFGWKLYLGCVLFVVGGGLFLPYPQWLIIAALSPAWGFCLWILIIIVLGDIFQRIYERKNRLRIVRRE